VWRDHRRMMTVNAHPTFDEKVRQVEVTLRELSLL
jgi:hypothetical protein